MRILSTEIEQLSHRSGNHAAAMRMHIQEMLRTLSIEERGGHVMVSGTLNHAGHISDFSLEISAYGEILEHDCSCPFHEPDDACGHIIALCTYLAKREFKLPYHLDFADEQRRRLREYQQQIQKLEQRRRQRDSHTWLQEEAMYLYPWEEKAQPTETIALFLELSPLASSAFLGCSLSLRIHRHGERMYVVRDLVRFLQTVQKGEMGSYGKGLSFLHRIDAFDKTSQDILLLLRQLFAQSAFASSMRSLRLEKNALDQVAAFLQTLPAGYCNYRWRQEPLRLQLRLEPQDDCMRVAALYALGEQERILSDAILTPSGLYEMDESQGVFYSYATDALGQVLRLYRTLLAKGELLLDREDFTQFYHAYLLRYPEYLRWQGTLGEGMLMEVEDALRLYLDVDDQMRLCARLELVYGDTCVPAFHEHNRRGESLKAQAVRGYLGELRAGSGEDHTIYLRDEGHWSECADRIHHALKESCQIYISERLRSANRPRPLSLSVGVRLENNLLDLHFDMGDIDPRELAGILKSYRRKQKFHRMKNGELLYLKGDALKEADELMRQLQVPQEALSHDTITLPGYRLYNIESLSEQQTHIRYDRASILSQREHLLQNKVAYPLPAALAQTLRDYQKEGFQWLKTLSALGFGGLLADDMGLGKTIQVLAYLCSEQAENKQSLVVCPASLLLNWQDEARRFAPSLACVAIYGSKAERKKRMEQGAQADLFITSYDYLKRDMELYEKRTFDTIILDEAQYISNPRTKNAQCVKKLRCRQRFALSGTPIENTLTELWSIYDFILPGYLYGHSQFSAMFERAIVKEQDAAMTARLQQLVQPFLLRRTKQEVLDELPDKEEHTLFFEFEKKEKELYLANAASAAKQIAQELDPAQDGIAILALITRLRQLCLDARLVYENIETPSGKLRGCMELIHSCIGARKKILLFSSFTSMLELVRKELENAEIPYFLLTGATPKEQRHRDIERFQNDDTPLYLISLKAGGTGLNLTAAEVVIHFDPWWNLSAQNQATDRAHRIGQHHNVQVYRLIMKHSIEEQIQKLQEKKKELAQLFVHTQRENLLKAMSREELLALFQEQE